MAFLALGACYALTISRILKVVDTPFWTQLDRKVHVYIGTMKAHKAPDAYFSEDIQNKVIKPAPRVQKYRRFASKNCLDCNNWKNSLF